MFILISMKQHCSLIKLLSTVKKKKRERALCLDTIYQNNNNYKEDFTTQNNLEFAWYDTFLGHTFSLNKEKGNL